jgi:hypothetical protein
VAAAPENPRSTIPMAIAARAPAAARTPSTAAHGSDGQRSHHLERDVCLGRDQVRASATSSRPEPKAARPPPRATRSRRNAPALDRRVAHRPRRPIR